jgi:hypothetical protein
VSEGLRAYGQVRMVIFALVVLGVMRLYPPGLIGLVRAAGARLPRRRGRAANVGAAA